MAGVAVQKKRSLIIKQESTRGTYSAPASADFNIPFFNIGYTIEKSITDGKYATGDFDSYQGIMGASKGTITASTYLFHSGAVDTAPDCGKALQMCGLNQVVNVATNVVYNSWDSFNLGTTSLPYSCLIQEHMSGASTNALTHQFTGCLANGKFVTEGVGMPWRLDLEIQGCFVGSADLAYANLLSPTGLDTTTPNSIKSATITTAGIAQRVSKFEIDIGNAIELENAPSTATGYLAAVITDRNPKISYDPLIDLLATDAVYTRWDAGTESAVAISSTNWAFAAPKAQIESISPSTQGNLLSFQQVLRLNRSSGNDAWTLTHT